MGCKGKKHNERTMEIGKMFYQRAPKEEAQGSKAHVCWGREISGLSSQPRRCIAGETSVQYHKAKGQNETKQRLQSLTSFYNVAYVCYLLFTM